nr:MAG TPA: hypothetical protein [Caudoviricetes sp.]
MLWQKAQAGEIERPPNRVRFREKEEQQGLGGGA